MKGRSLACLSRRIPCAGLRSLASGQLLSPLWASRLFLGCVPPLLCGLRSLALFGIWLGRLRVPSERFCKVTAFSGNRQSLAAIFNIL